MPASPSPLVCGVVQVTAAPFNVCGVNYLLKLGVDTNDLQVRPAGLPACLPELELLSAYYVDCL